MNEIVFDGGEVLTEIGILAVLAFTAIALIKNWKQMKRSGKIISAIVAVIVTGAVMNWLIVEIKVQRKIASVTLGMTTNQVLAVIGSPTTTGSSVAYPGGKPEPATTFLAYDYPYSWDYVSLLWSRDLLYFPHGRGMKVEFDQSGTVSAVWISRPYVRTATTVRHR